jgi:DNA-binding CsgD family transcriptional regulator
VRSRPSPTVSPKCISLSCPTPDCGSIPQTRYPEVGLHSVDIHGTYASRSLGRTSHGIPGSRTSLRLNTRQNAVELKGRDGDLPSAACQHRGAYCPSAINRVRRVMDDRRPSFDLTARERQVLTLAAVGLSNKEIGHQLRLSAGTVGIHLHSIYQKLGVSNRTALVSAIARARVFEGDVPATVIPAQQPRMRR